MAEIGSACARFVDSGKCRIPGYQRATVGRSRRAITTAFDLATLQQGGLSVGEALTVDRLHAAYLLSRKATIAQRIEYALIRFFKISTFFNMIFVRCIRQFYLFPQQHPSTHERRFSASIL